MAETRKITIELIQTESEGGTPKPTPEGDEAKDQKKTASEGEMLLKSVILNQGYAVAKKLVIQGVEANINRYLTLSEDYMAENTYNQVKTVISKVSSAVTTIGGSALAGAKVGGVYGAVAGAVIGTVGYGVSEVMSYTSRMSGFYRSLNASNIETSYARKRAGLTDNSRGTEN